jgi:hypothetical protein
VNGHNFRFCDLQGIRAAHALPLDVHLHHDGGYASVGGLRKTASRICTTNAIVV